jgi:membrane protein
VSALSRGLARLKATHAYRSWDRYGNARGDVLAGGVTYVGFFSLVPALLLGFTVFGFILRGQPELFDRVVASISDTLPGIVRDRAHPGGLIDASNPPTPSALTLTGLVSLATLLLSGTAWIDALREGVRAVFGQPKLAVNPVKGRLVNLALLGTLGSAFLVSGVLSLGVSSAGSWLLDRVGVGADSTVGQVTLRAGAVLAVLVADTLLVVLVLRLMSGVDLPRSDLLQGAVLGAVGLGILKQASGLLLASAANKPVLGSFAVVVGLLVLLDLISRILLLSAAWAATTADEGGRLAVGAAAPQHEVAIGPREQSVASFGQRSADRTAVAAGAVLGLIAAVGVRSVRDALRSAADAVRER